ncbi:alpha/beta hydrolase [Alteribacillus sp. HJP-4]|uniref:alpha/beta hydrolase n=1 Tax=Alteribacillus sp. HJP-4 TaxID=2775394 RepID=UPI0035CD0AC8
MKIYLWDGSVPCALSDREEDRPYLTPFLVNSKRSSGAVIICPGGGYSHLAVHEGVPVAEWLNDMGLSAFVLNYRIHPYKHPVPLIDVKRAVRYVRSHAEHWNIDTEKIGILGFSAGGHLAASSGMLFDNGDVSAHDPVEKVSSRPDVMVLCYPVITFGEHGHKGSQQHLLGEEASEKLQAYLSMEKQVTNQSPPAFIWHTANDDSVPVENSLLLASSFSRNKIPYELHIYDNGSHGLGLAANDPHVRTWTKLCEKWLRKQFTY